MPEELRQPPKHDTPELAEERDKTIEVQDVESDLPAAPGTFEWIECRIMQFGNTELRVIISRATDKMKDGKVVGRKRAALGHVTLDEWDSICEAVEDMRRKNLLE